MFPKYIFSLLCLIPLCLILLCSIPISCYATFRCACFRYAWFQIAHFNVMTDSCSLLCLIPLCLITLCLIPVLMKPRYAWFRYTRFRCTWFHFCMLCPIPLCQVPPSHGKFKTKSHWDRSTQPSDWGCPVRKDNKFLGKKYIFWTKLAQKGHKFTLFNQYFIEDYQATTPLSVDTCRCGFFNLVFHIILVIPCM